jgi:hypothetical protein
MVIACCVLGATSAQAGNPIKGTNGCGDIQVKPELVVFACADAGLRAGKLNWDHWGARKAKAQGTLLAKVCDPSCAGGYFEKYPVTLVFRKIKTVTTCGGRTIRMYTRYKMDTDGGQPAGFGRYDKGRLALFC